MPIGGGLATGVGALNAFPTPTPEQMTKTLNNPPLADDPWGIKTISKLFGWNQPQTQTQPQTAPAPPSDSPTTTATPPPPTTNLPPFNVPPPPWQSAAVQSWADPRGNASARAGPARRSTKPPAMAFLARNRPRLKHRVLCSLRSIAPTPTLPAGEALPARLPPIFQSGARTWRAGADGRARSLELVQSPRCSGAGSRPPDGAGRGARPCARPAIGPGAAASACGAAAMVAAASAQGRRCRGSDVEESGDGRRNGRTGELTWLFPSPIFNPMFRRLARTSPRLDYANDQVPS